MLFRLPNYACKKIYLALWLSLSLSPGGHALEDDIFSLKGRVRGLSSTNVKHMALRSDGRFLFYSGGGAEWNVLDLLDMVTKLPTAVAVDAPVFGLALVNDTRLVVATANGVQYFDVSTPFEPEEELDKFERPTSAGETDVKEACVDKNQRVYLLEDSLDDDKQLVRIVQGETELGEALWPNIFGTNSADIVPVAMRCAENSLIILGIDLESEDSDRYLARIPFSNPSGSVQIVHIDGDEIEDYEIVDFGLDADGNRVLLMLNATEDGSKEDNAYTLVRSFLAENLNSSFTVNMGAGGLAIARYKTSENNSSYSFFMGKNYFDNIFDPDLDELLTVKSDLFSAVVGAAQFGEDQGEISFGDSGVGSKPFSQWASTPDDHYVYGLTENVGVSLMTAGAALNFVEDPEVPVLSSSQDIEFSILSDRDLNYEIRVEEDPPTDTTTEGLNYLRGRRVKTGDLIKDQETPISLSVDELGIRTNALHRLFIFGRYKLAGASDPISRLGLQFSFDPPPRPVSKFRLSFGDQSVHVFFEPDATSGDLEQFNIYFSYTSADLDELPSSDEELEVWRRTVEGLNGQEFSSPAIVSAASFNGRYVIAPLENNRELFVRVQVVDESGQFSTDNPEALGIAPLKTKSLSAAFGGTNSCSLQMR